MKVCILNGKPAEVNGTKPKSLRYGHVKRLLTKREPSKEFPLLDSRMVSMGVLSDDFATVDLREDYATIADRKRQNSRDNHNGKTNEKKGSHGGKSGSRSPSGSAGTAPRRRTFRFGFPVIFLFAFPWRVLGCGVRARSAKVCVAATAATQCIKAALVYAKHTLWCQNKRNNVYSLEKCAN